ncbi:MAG: hypothetical protein JF626_07540, partial [Polaromonas sp.]|nr:hypothetical protein [Polaromonas sp.]
AYALRGAGDDADLVFESWHEMDNAKKRKRKKEEWEKGRICDAAQ